MKVNFSPENENKAFLARYAEIPGYPHLFETIALKRLR